jgi:hypothetical protein
MHRGEVPVPSHNKIDISCFHDSARERERERERSSGRGGGERIGDIKREREEMRGRGSSGVAG